ncbi:MAG: biosynthetic-type acetolactate synthase large subunit [archaeon]
MTRMSGSEALFEALRREEVRVAFGIPGGVIMSFYDALYRLNKQADTSGIRHILARHEQSAAHMADGYARASGRTGVCVATSGPGATNLVTGITTAHMDSSPIVAITGQVARDFVGKDAFQETDIVGVATSVTKYAFQVTSASEIPVVVRSAFHIANSGRPGPVLIDLPADVQTETMEITFPGEPRLGNNRPTPIPDPNVVAKMAEMLLQAETPLILAGGGVKISGASPELLALAEKLCAPVATSFMGKGVIPEDHPLSIGVMGMHGSSEANAIAGLADVILVVGSRLSDRTTGKVEKFCPGCKILHIDIDNSEIGKNKSPYLSMVSDAKAALAAMNRIVARSAHAHQGNWFSAAKTKRELLESELRTDGPCLSAPVVLKLLRKIIPREAIITTDVGQNQMWASLHFEAYSPRKFISSGGLGTMGFGFPAALGAKVACPDQHVLDISGDGGFGMTENSLATSVEEDIPVTVLVLNNRVLGMVAMWHRLFYERRYCAVKLGKSPDFVKLTKAYGAEAERVCDYKELEKAVRTALTSRVTTVIDIPISSEEDVLPMLTPGAGVGEKTQK